MRVAGDSEVAPTVCKLAHGLILNPCASLHLLPVFRDQRRRFGPRLFHQRVLEPLLSAATVKVSPDLALKAMVRRLGFSAKYSG